jgi:hypothetical protein
MIIVGTGKALTYPTGGCTDPRNACAYTETKPYTMRICGNLSDRICIAEAREMSKSTNERVGAVQPHCLHLRVALTCRLDW